MTEPHTRNPMTRAEAEQNIAAMLAKTPRNAMRALLRHALGPIGNLSDDAREVYRAALADITA